MSEDLELLLAGVNRGSRRLRIAMAITAVLCVIIAAGIASDDSVWRSGPGWRLAGAAGVLAFLAFAALAIHAVVRGQRKRIGALRHLLLNHPERIRSVRLQVARAAPHAGWTADDGTAERGLHVIVSDDTGATWVLPASRREAPHLMAAFARRCPRAVVDSGHS